MIGNFDKLPVERKAEMWKAIRGSIWLFFGFVIVTQQVLSILTPIPDNSTCSRVHPAIMFNQPKPVKPWVAGLRIPTLKQVGRPLGCPFYSLHPGGFLSLYHLHHILHNNLTFL